MNGKKRALNEKIVDAIANSCVDDLYSWVHAININCYAFARGLTYPDEKHEYYTPGKLYKMKFGNGSIVNSGCDPCFIDKCIMNDSIALNQHCERVSFNSIKKDDGYFYFALVDFHAIAFGKNSHHWHFICRTQNGLWLHKPNWYQDVQTVNWIEYGKNLCFATLSREQGKNTPYLFHGTPLYIPCEGSCFEDYFYRVEFSED
mgnify:FL=1